MKENSKGLKRRSAIADSVYFKHYLQPAFLICAAILAVAGSGMSIAIKNFGIYLKKKPLPLKKSLDLLDEKSLGPYKVVSKEKIENEEIVKGLGTEDYIQWILEDSEAAADSAVRKCSLFITYYELPDLVLHVPEECYMGSGYQRLASDSMTFEVDGISGTSGEETIQGRYLVFASVNSSHWQRETKFPVLYIFNVNGLYRNSREGTRVVLNRNIRGKYSYFSKVEWTFFNTEFGAKIYPSKEELVTASQRLLGVILPILERQHWPDWAETVNDS